MGATPHRVAVELLMEHPAKPLWPRPNFNVPRSIHRFDSFGVRLRDVIANQVDREISGKGWLRLKPEVLAAGLVVVYVKSFDHRATLSRLTIRDRIQLSTSFRSV
jgi:hypothetical protein